MSVQRGAAEAGGSVCGEEAVSLTRPEGTALWSGLRREPVPEDGALGAGLCGSLGLGTPGR